MKTIAKTFKLIISFAMVLGIFSGLVAIWIFSKIPSEKEIKGCFITEMYKVNLCPNSGHYTPLNRISNHLQKFVIISEDSTFWQHDGFDYQALQKSLKENISKGRYVKGGSTISQQLAKNLFLNMEKTLTRKGIEALITIKLEKVLTKKEILEKYFNVVQFGKNIYGVKDAASFYFKKSPAELNAAEAAFLIFLLPNPDIYSKSYYKRTLTPFARKRINDILDRAYRYNHLSDNDFLDAKSRLDYFLTGQNPPEIDSELDAIDEESVENFEDL